MRLIDADALYDEYLSNMQELVKSTNHEHVDLDALSLLCGAKLITDAKTVNGWISVKDRLPEVDAYDCLVYSRHVEPAVYFQKEEGIWYTQDCYESEEIIGVLYWMPYPEPPKEDKRDEERAADD